MSAISFFVTSFTFSSGHVQHLSRRKFNWDSRFQRERKRLVPLLLKNCSLDIQSEICTAMCRNKNGLCPWFTARNFWTFLVMAPKMSSIFRKSYDRLDQCQSLFWRAFFLNTQKMQIRKLSNVSSTHWKKNLTRFISVSLVFVSQQSCLRLLCSSPSSIRPIEPRPFESWPFEPLSQSSITGFTSG